MLVLSRKRDSSIHIGADIRVTILGIHGNQVKVGVEAPAAVPVWRDEALPKGRTGLEVETREDGWSSGKRAFEVLLVEDDLGHAKLICGAFSECRLPTPIEVAVAQTGELAAESLGMDSGQRLCEQGQRSRGISDFHCSDCRFLGQRMPRSQTTRLLPEIAR